MNKKETVIDEEEFLDNVERHHWKNTFLQMARDWRIYLMMIPLIFFFVCWRYIPMTGLLIAFKDYDGLSVTNSDWSGLIGLQTIMFGASSSDFWRAFRNTFTLSFYNLIFGFPMPIILALLFSEVKNQGYRSVLQVLSYLPKFVSTVVMTTLVTLLLKSYTIDAATGTVQSSGGPLTMLFVNLHWMSKSVDLMYTSSAFRPIYVISGIWEAAGYGSIVYFAAILSISPTSYEAARMDGATKMEQIRHVTIPGISSTLIIMLILDIGKLLTIGYEKVLLLYNASTYETADVISTYVYRTGVVATGSSLLKAIASSADLFNSFIAMLLVIGSNSIARRVSDTSLY